MVEHASRLARDHGFDVTLAITHHPDEAPWPYPGLDEVRVAALDDVLAEPFDLAVATWWETVIHLTRVATKRAAYFVQSLEDRFYPPEDASRGLAGLTYQLGLPVLTEAGWIARYFAEVDPSLPCFLVPNGVDKDVFPVAGAPDRSDGPLRILIEGNPQDPIKGVPDAVAATRMMREPASVTVVAARGGTVDGFPVVGPLAQRDLSDLMARTDVLLKLSRVEGMAGPPLEGFHRGATAVLTPVTGHEEYVQHGWNALLAGWDDPRGTARQLDLLARDRDLLHFLRTNALRTAADWPDWDTAAARMADALRAAAEAPGPDLGMLRGLLVAARRQVALESRLAHRQRVVTAELLAENGRLQGEWQSALEHARLFESRATESHQRLEEAVNRLAHAEQALSQLSGSTTVRALSRLQRLLRRGRGPTLGQHLAALGDEVRPPR